MNAVLAILNIFLDPAASVRHQRTQGKLAWLPPLAVAAAVSIGIAYLLRPLMEQAMYNDLLDQMAEQKARESMEFIRGTLTFSMIMTPVMLAVMLAISGALVLGVGTILGARLQFPEVFTLLAHCSLIPLLAQVAQVVTVKLRGTLDSMKQMQPAFGLDLLLDDEAPRLLAGLLNYLSFFTLWYIVILGLGFAALAGVCKAKGFAMTAPVWLLGLVFALAGSLVG
ncbi:MAG: YIP1 family protein [Acidobacteriaceae bacterium]|nr:YIP1 family protein [Acidobacteriaceae bacterium]